jgi:O-antigen ligase
MLRLLFAATIFYTVYSLHYPLDTGIPGVNLSNLLFVATLAAVLSHVDPGLAVPRASLRSPILLYFVTVVAAWVVARARGDGDALSDATWLKNALFYPLFYFLALRSRLDLRQTRQMIVLVFAVAALAAVQAIRQGLDYGFGSFVETHRASGPFGTSFAMANRAGVYYAMYVPVFLAIAVTFRRQKLWRVAGGVGLALMVGAILATYSRQSYGIALVGVAIVVLRRSFLLSLVMAAAIVVLIGYLPESVTERVQETQQRSASGGIEVDPSTASRWEIWDGGMAMWRQHPFGVGLDRFHVEIGRYAPKFADYDAHNFYVLTLCENGVLGLAALLWLMRCLLRLARRLRESAPAADSEAQGLTLGFGVMVISMMLGNLYGSAFSEGAVMGDFWLLCGLLERYIAYRAEGAAGTAAAPADPRLQMASRFPLAARAAGIHPGPAEWPLLPRPMLPRRT